MRRHEKRHGSGNRAVGTHLSEQEVVTDAFSDNEANIQEIEPVKKWFEQNVYSRREDSAKEKMVFSKESSRVFSKWAMWCLIFR